MEPKVFLDKLCQGMFQKKYHMRKNDQFSPHKENGWQAELSQIVNDILESKSFKDREWINVTEAKDKYEKYKKRK